ncbi:MAG: hypothetical protein K0R78_2729 [Pelosinus sp.]|jgi:hypothetical protein|nr:hypothetical protein [Pelosinus sp.]
MGVATRTICARCDSYSVTNIRELLSEEKPDDSGFSSDKIKLEARYV